MRNSVSQEDQNLLDQASEIVMEVQSISPKLNGEQEAVITNFLKFPMAFGQVPDEGNERSDLLDAAKMLGLRMTVKTNSVQLAQMIVDKYTC